MAEEKQPKKKIPLGTRLVTVVLIGLCVVFAGFITFSYIQKQNPPAAQSAGGASAGAGQAPVGGAGAGGSPAGGQGSQGQRQGQAPAGAPSASGGSPPAASSSAPASGQAGAGAGGSAQADRQAGGGRPGQAPAAGGAAPGAAGQASGGAGPAAGAAGQSGGAAGQSRGTAVRVAPIVLNRIENRVIINGDVMARTQVSIYPAVAGKLSNARLQVGDAVQAGETVAEIDPSRPGDVYSKSPVVSPVSGTVLSAPVNQGDTLTTQTAVYVVGDLSALLVETFIPERYATIARKGLPGAVMLEAISGETFDAVVDEVSPVLDTASRTLRIRLRFTKPDPRIKAGMFATVTLVTNARQDVPVVPRSAVINTYGKWVVFAVMPGNVAQRREITLGLESEELIEVLSGLTVGDQVVIAGQNFLSDGDPIRIIES